MDETKGVVAYRGDGSQYIEGIPARDLTQEEWNRLAQHLRTLALASGLYQELAAVPLRERAAQGKGKE